MAAVVVVAVSVWAGLLATAAAVDEVATGLAPAGELVVAVVAGEGAVGRCP